MTPSTPQTPPAGSSGPPRRQLVILAVFAGVLVLLGSYAAVATYGSMKKRTEIFSRLVETGALRAEVERALRGEAPMPRAAAADLAVDSHGAIRVQFGERYDHATVDLRPVREGAAVAWKCKGRGLPRGTLPAPCREDDDRTLFGPAPPR